MALAALGWQFTSAARWDCCCITSDVAAGSSDALTEAALHFGRQKRAKQSLLLVQRYKKFKEQETRAEAERQLASLEQTPPQDREQLLRDLHDELRAMARGATTITVALFLGSYVLADCSCATNAGGACSSTAHACNSCCCSSNLVHPVLLRCTCSAMAECRRAASGVQVFSNLMYLTDDPVVYCCRNCVICNVCICR